MLVTKLEVLWTKACAKLDFNPDDDDREDLLSEEDAEKLRRKAAPERERLARARLLGIPFVNAERELGGTLRDFRLAAVHLSHDGRWGRVVRTLETGDRGGPAVTISFPIRSDGDDWDFALGPVERVDRAPAPGDEQGWLKRPEWANAARETKVSGGPAGITDAQRAEVAAGIEECWSRWHIGLDWEKGSWLYAVNLDADGKKARAVFSDGEITILTGLVQTDGVWEHDSGAAEEGVGRPPVPDDRDGWLTK
jgi:hypothetical protein